MLAKSPFKVVGEAVDAPGTLALARKLKPSVVIMNTTYSVEADPFETARTIVESISGTKVIMMSALENTTYMAKAKAAGASGFLLESMTSTELRGAIEIAVAGRAVKSTTSFAKVVASMDAQPGVNIGRVKLTPREFQVLTHVARGLSNDEITRSLGISLDTVKEHAQQILRKLVVIDRTQAAVWALKSGVLEG